MNSSDMNVAEILDKLKLAAVSDNKLLDDLINTEKSKSPVSDFCRISSKAGFQIYEMDLVGYGEEAYAAMRRSTNGGGENSPLLEFEDDIYILFIQELKLVKAETDKIK